MLLTELFNKGEFILPKGDLPNVDIKSITIDSRNAVPNSLFVCLKGSFRDGHMFAPNAYAKGCRCFLCDKELDEIMGDDAIIIKVKDSRKMLAHVAARFYRFPANELKVIGITGTKGKTTTALITMKILNACGLNCGYIGSNGVYFNNSSYKTENTTPESLILQRTLREMADNKVKYVALEVSSQALLTHRVEWVKFDVVAFTNLARDHVGKFEHPTFENYIECKSRLFTKKYGANLCVRNVDDTMCDTVTSGFKNKFLSYSMKGNGDINTENVKYYQTSDGAGVMFDLKYKDDTYPAFLPIPGDFNVYNAMCAFAICQRYVKDHSDIIKAMATAKVDGRLEMYRSKKGFTFVIDYAHNGLSLACALQELRKYCTGQLICLFGSVGDRTKERRRELGEAAGVYADLSIITSDNPGFEEPNYIISEIAFYVKSVGGKFVSITDREEAIKYAYSIAKKDDIILLAGKGHETYQLIEGAKKPFSEKMIVKKLLERENAQIASASDKK